MVGPRIVSVGARAALGLNALQVAMSVRAGLFEPRACRFRDARGQSVGMCRIGGLGGDRHGYERMIEIAIPALREAVHGRDLTGFGLVVALPLRGRADDEDRFEGFAADLVQRADIGIDPRSAMVVRKGHAGGVEALRRAADQLATRPGMIVGGVDSHYHPEVLRALDDAYRLHALGVEDGFVPAEGAAFLVLQGDSRPDDLATLVDARTGEEPAMLDESEPDIAAGLTRLVREAGATASRWVFHDENGEHRRRREWGMVALRHELANGEVIRLPDELGDLGAATAPVMAAIAATWWRHDCAPDRRAFLMVSSDLEQRGVAILERAGS